MKKAIIVLPTYNEKDTIERIVSILEEKVFPKILTWEMGILVADDLSPDGTGDIVRSLMRKYKRLSISEAKKKGLGAAYIRGMGYAIENMHADVVFEMDSDLQHDPLKIPAFLDKISEGYDMVIGTRYSNGGSIPASWGLHRKFLSVFGNFLIRLILMRWNIHDWTGGYRALTKEVFLKERVKISSLTGYYFQVGLLLRVVQDGYRVAEVPFHFSDRTAGKSKIPGIETIVKTLQFVIFARMKELERVLKFLVVGGIGFIVQLLAQEGSVALGVSHPSGVAIGAEVAIISNFLFNNFWTFRDTGHIQEKGNFFIRMIKFNIASIAAVIIQYLADFLAELLLGSKIHFGHYVIATRIVILFPTIILLVIPLNYLIYNKFIWKTQYLKNVKSTVK